MIVTLTANPSLDRTVELDEALVPGAVQRATSTRQDPGGKGVNVTRALLASGVASVAVLPAEPGDPFLAALAAEGVPSRAVPIRGAVRTNLTIVDAAGVTTKVNEPGPVLDADAQARLIEVTADAASGADWLVLAGSLPPGVADDFYVRVVEAVRDAADLAGTPAPRIAADTSGAALLALVTGGVGIDLIKPNAEELAELLGASDEAALEDGPDEAIALARTLPAERVRASLVTLGAVGAALVTEEAAWFARAPRVIPRSTVGAGDCSLAGYLVAAVEGEAPAGALARAVASGAAAVALPGSAVPTRDLIDPARVVVTEVAGLPAGDRQ
jgi:1-phosphofructokinase